MRAGWGFRDPAFATVLRTARPSVTETTAWANGAIPLRISAYTTPVELPDHLIVSVRCIVRVGGLVVVCTNRNGWSHPWPGGRRETGETWAETARREVHEETGWLLDTAAIRRLGWLHFEHLKAQPADHPWPHPDFLNVVCTATAYDRSGGVDVDWSDTEGFEVRSQAMTLDDALRVCRDGLPQAFLRLVGTERPARPDRPMRPEPGGGS